MRKTTVKVNHRYQISLRSAARQQLNIQAGDRLLVDVQEGIIVLIPQPKGYVEHLAGLYQEIWQSIDGTAYLDDEREAWQTSDNK